MLKEILLIPLIFHQCYGIPIPRGEAVIPVTYLSGYAAISISLVVFVLFGLLVMGCVCCKQKNIKALGCQNGFPVSRLNENNSLQFGNPAELAIFPPHSAVIDLQPVNPSFNGYNEKVTFEPLPDILPKNATNGQSAASSSKPAHFSALLKSKISLHDWFDDPSSNFPREQLQYLQVLGNGWFGHVVEGEATSIVSGEEKTPVIVKILREEASPSEHLHFLHEVRPYRDLMHPNVVQLLGRCLESDPFLLIMEHSLKDLKTYLIEHQTDKDSLLADGVLLRMSCNLASGLRYMHEKGFPHVDLAAHNCFLTSDLILKIGDYGISFDLFKDDYYCLDDIALPIRWYSPEIVICSESTIETKEITKASNVWAFAVVLWEIFEFGKLPYTMLSNEEVLQKVLVERILQLPSLTLEFPGKSEISFMMNECWKPPSQRPPMVKVEDFITQMYKHSSNIMELSFEEKWNALQSRYSGRSLSDPPAVSFNFERDFSKCEANCVSDSEALSSFETSDFLGKNEFNSCFSPSLRVLNGSIDELMTDNDISVNGLSMDEIYENDSHSNATGKDYSDDEGIVTPEQISAAMTDLDLVLTNQACDVSRQMTMQKPHNKLNMERCDMSQNSYYSCDSLSHSIEMPLETSKSVSPCNGVIAADVKHIVPNISGIDANRLVLSSVENASDSSVNESSGQNGYFDNSPEILNVRKMDSGYEHMNDINSDKFSVNEIGLEDKPEIVCDKSAILNENQNMNGTHVPATSSQEIADNVETISVTTSKPAISESGNDNIHPVISPDIVCELESKTPTNYKTFTMPLPDIIVSETSSSEEADDQDNESIIINFESSQRNKIFRFVFKDEETPSNTNHTEEMENELSECCVDKGPLTSTPIKSSSSTDDCLEDENVSRQCFMEDSDCVFEKSSSVLENGQKFDDDDSHQEVVEDSPKPKPKNDINSQNSNVEFNSEQSHQNCNENILKIIPNGTQIDLVTLEDENSNLKSISSNLECVDNRDDTKSSSLSETMKTCFESQCDEKSTEDASSVYFSLYQERSSNLMNCNSETLSEDVFFSPTSKSLLLTDISENFSKDAQLEFLDKTSSLNHVQCDSETISEDAFFSPDSKSFVLTKTANSSISSESDIVDEFEPRKLSNDNLESEVFEVSFKDETLKNVSELTFTEKSKFEPCLTDDLEANKDGDTDCAFKDSDEVNDNYEINANYQNEAMWDSYHSNASHSAPEDSESESMPNSFAHDNMAMSTSDSNTSDRYVHLHDEMNGPHYSYDVDSSPENECMAKYDSIHNCKNMLNGQLDDPMCSEVIIEDLETGEQTLISGSFADCDNFGNSVDSDEILKIDTETDEAIIVDSSESLIGFVPSRSIELLQEFEVIPTIDEAFRVEDESLNANFGVVKSAPTSPYSTKNEVGSPRYLSEAEYPSTSHLPYRNFSLQNEIIEEEITEEISSPLSIQSMASYSSNDIFMGEEQKSASVESGPPDEMFETSSMPEMEHFYAESDDGSKTDITSSPHSSSDVGELGHRVKRANRDEKFDSRDDVMFSHQPSQSVCWNSDDMLNENCEARHPVIIEGEEILAGEVKQTAGLSLEDITNALHQLDTQGHCNHPALSHLNVSHSPSPYSSSESSPCRDAVYTPDFESDSEEESPSSCSSTSGSFECIHNKFKNAVDISKVPDSSGGEASESSREQSPMKVFSKTWDCHATPTKSALVTPEKKPNTMRKSVSFHEDDPHVVFEYPPASDSSEDGYPEEEFTWNIDYTKYADWDLQATDSGEIMETGEMIEIEELEAEPYVRRPTYAGSSVGPLNRPMLYTLTAGFSDEDMDSFEGSVNPQFVAPSNSPEEGKQVPMSEAQMNDIISNQLKNLAEERLKWLNNVFDDELYEASQSPTHSHDDSHSSVQSVENVSNPEKPDVALHDIVIEELVPDSNNEITTVHNDEVSAEAESMIVEVTEGNEKDMGCSKISSYQFAEISSKSNENADEVLLPDMYYTIRSHDFYNENEQELDHESLDDKKHTESDASITEANSGNTRLLISDGNMRYKKNGISKETNDKDDDEKAKNNHIKNHADTANENNTLHLDKENLNSESDVKKRRNSIEITLPMANMPFSDDEKTTTNDDNCVKGDSKDVDASTDKGCDLKENESKNDVNGASSSKFEEHSRVDETASKLSVPEIIITPASESDVEEELDEYLRSQLEHYNSPSVGSELDEYLQSQFELYNSPPVDDFTVTSEFSKQPFDDVFKCYDVPGGANFIEAYNFEIDNGDFFDDFMGNFPDNSYQVSENLFSKKSVKRSSSLPLVNENGFDEEDFTSKSDSSQAYATASKFTRV